MIYWPAVAELRTKELVGKTPEAQDGQAYRNRIISICLLCTGFKV